MVLSYLLIFFVLIFIIGSALSAGLGRLEPGSGRTKSSGAWIRTWTGIHSVNTSMHYTWMFHKRNVENDNTFCSYVMCLVSILRIRGMPWPIKRRGMFKIWEEKN